MAGDDRTDDQDLERVERCLAIADKAEAPVGERRIISDEPVKFLLLKLVYPHL